MPPDQKKNLFVSVLVMIVCCYWLTPLLN